MRARTTAWAVATVLVIGCGDDDGDPLGALEDRIDVAAALAVDDGTRVTVAGHLIALPDGTSTLCGGPIRESAPPSCGDPALPVDGLDDPTTYEGATDVGSWVEGDVEITGTLRGGRLQVP